MKVRAGGKPFHAKKEAHGRITCASLTNGSIFRVPQGSPPYQQRMSIAHYKSTPADSVKPAANAIYTIRYRWHLSRSFADARCVIEGRLATLPRGTGVSPSSIETRGGAESFLRLVRKEQWPPRSMLGLPGRRQVEPGDRTVELGKEATKWPEGVQVLTLAGSQLFHTTEVNAYLLRVPDFSVFEGCGF
jgi:hypothetical protein